MMNNLFSIFDPSTSINFNWNWSIIILWSVLIPYSFWGSSSLFLISWKNFLNGFFQEIKNNLKYFKIKNNLILTSMFLIIMFMNLMGLLPYVFTATSHLVITMFFAFPFWITLIFYTFINKFNKSMSHMVPMGSPMFLSFFMVIIETISNMIRPITLSIRLTANMISGHLLIHLLSSTLSLGKSYFILSIPFMMILLILETAVALIQSFVFVILMTLYINES
uniref:F-ATPase protein 6 n=1 Tax=Hyalomma scupense TaxID=1260755 RepID=A0A8E7DLB8_HYASC|nr:ATP synthase subunit 6 [Hyalomma scupense]